MCKSLVGKHFTRLVVIKRAPNKPGCAKVRWLCACTCGTVVAVQADSLVSNHTKSCGCLHKERAAMCNTTHGHAKPGAHSVTYNAWVRMRSRCYCATNNDYHHYGGRGIVVCKRWRISFENFLADMGERPQGLSLERMNNSGNYTPTNCKWATQTEQVHNRRPNHNAHMLTCYGETKCVAAWVRDSRVAALNLSDVTLLARLRRGWSSKKTLTTKLR